MKYGVRFAVSPWPPFVPPLDRASVPSLFRGQRRRVENALIEREIEPVAKLETRVTDGSRVLEAQTEVERDAGGITRVDASHHHVLVT